MWVAIRSGNMRSWLMIAARPLSDTLPAIADTHNQNGYALILDLRNDAIVADAIFPVSRKRAGERLPKIARIIERRHALAQEAENALPILRREPLHLLVDLGVELDPPQTQTSSASSRLYFSIISSSEIRGPFASTRCSAR
jgi:hypothetical protein